MRPYGSFPRQGHLHGSNCKICKPDIPSSEGRSKARRAKVEETDMVNAEDYDAHKKYLRLIEHMPLAYELLERVLKTMGEQAPFVQEIFDLLESAGWGEEADRD